MATILVIDDEILIRRFVAKNLTGRGYEVYEAGDAEQGLDVLRTRAVDAVLLDIKLPGMDGWEFLDVLAADNTLSHIPVVIITGTMLFNEVNEHHYPNVVNVLIKPLIVQQLLDGITQALGRSQSADQLS